jgi:hypothetical protein
MIRQGMPSAETQMGPRKARPDDWLRASSRWMTRGRERLGDRIRRKFFNESSATGNTADQQVNLKLLNIIWDVPNSLSGGASVFPSSNFGLSRRG